MVDDASERPPGLQTVVSTPQDCDSSTLRGDTTEKDESAPEVET